LDYKLAIQALDDPSKGSIVDLTVAHQYTSLVLVNQYYNSKKTNGKHAWR
jgi:hypothetical protein